MQVSGAVRGRVLSVASECVPLIKTGGLADVVGALPAALAAVGWEMRVLLPAYRALRGYLDAMDEVLADPNLFGGPARVMAGQIAGLSVLLLDAPHLYDRDGGPYAGPAGDWPDNAQRFAALSWIAARIAREGVQGWQPDVLHAHDWQAGLAPAYLRYGGAASVASVMTIHNMAFQGWAPAHQLAALRLPPDQYYPAALEYYGGLSSLKAGLVTADAVTTVSPNYARELVRPEFGLGLEGVIAARAASVFGVLNGIDTEVWSPEREAMPYSAKKMQAKAAHRAALCPRSVVGGMVRLASIRGGDEPWPLLARGGASGAVARAGEMGNQPWLCAQAGRGGMGRRDAGRMACGCARDVRAV